MPGDQIDISKIKVGDELDIRVKVIGAEPGKRFEAMAAHVNVHVWVDPADIISHTPKALEVGDRVRDPQGREWEIAAPKRQTEHSYQYSIWRATVGYDAARAELVESWERLDAQ